MPAAVPLSEIVSFVSGRYSGPEATIVGVASLSRATEQHVSFLSNQKYADQLLTSRAAAVFVANEQEGDSPAWIRVADPYVAYAMTVNRFFAARPRPKGISPHAVIAASAKLGRDVAVGAFTLIDEDVEIGDGAVIYPHVTIQPGVVIGAGTIVYPQVSIYHGCRIGRRCIIHSGVVIGADGFGFAPVAGTHRKIEQVGIVRIEDDVEIGAGTTIDRAALDETVIGEGTKIDNLVQIGHNVRIGKACILVSQVGIAGSTTLGDRVRVGGQSGFAGHLEIGDDVDVYSKSAVFKSLPKGTKVRGIPALPLREYARLHPKRKKDK